MTIFILFDRVPKILSKSRLQRIPATKFQKYPLGKGTVSPPKGISSQPVVFRFVWCTECSKKSIRRTTVSGKGRRGGLERLLSAVSQWSESNACRPKTEPREHLHTGISMHATRRGNNRLPSVAICLRERFDRQFRVYHRDLCSLDNIEFFIEISLNPREAIDDVLFHEFSSGQRMFEEK